MAKFKCPLQPINIMKLTKSALMAASVSEDRAEELCRIVKQKHPHADLDLIRLAFDYAKRAHSTQKRESGEPYFTHPLETALILAKLGLQEKIIAAALLHDVLEDTDTSLEFLENTFGK